MVDDNGVDRVEFFHNGDLVATDVEEPFECSVVLASEHNGAQTFWAVAYDTAEQSAESGQLGLSMNVLGGQQLGALDDLGLVQFGQASYSYWHSLPTLGYANADGLVVAATTQSSADPERGLGFAFRRVTTDFSVLQDEDFYGSYGGFSRPAVGMPSAGQTVVGGLRLVGDTVHDELFFVDHGGGGIERLPTTHTHPHYSGLAQAPFFAVAHNGDYFLASGPAEIARYSPDLTDQLWSSPLTEQDSGVGIYSGTTLQDGGIAVIYRDDDCTAGQQVCIKKLSADGETSWTRGLQSFWHGEYTTPQEDDDGTIFVVSGEDAIATFSPAGEDSGDIFLPNGWLTEDLQTVALSPSGSIILLSHGTTPGSNPPVPWLASITRSGEVVWQEELNVGPNATIGGDLLMTEEGQLYVTGVSFETGMFWEYAQHLPGTLWLAEHSL